MAWKKTDDTYYGEIASAIRAKNSTNNTYQPSQMANAINALPEFVDEEAALVLIDWEGTLLRSYTRDEVMALTALPYPSTLPNYAYADHDLLTFQEWNWSLANIKTWIQAHEGETLDVGAIYTTTDGQDHNYWGNPRLGGTTHINMKKMGSTGDIPANTFNGYSSLSAISFPYGVTKIGYQAFWNCNLKMINVPSTVTEISYSICFGNRALKQINFSNNAKLSSGLFQQCYSLEKANIPNGTTEIGASFFVDCFSLTNVIIPSSVIAIRQNSFKNCRNLPKIGIPDSITSIGDSAFNGCGSLCDILLESKPTLANTNAFSGLPSIYKIYVPRADLSWFETATNWSTVYTQGHIVVIEDYIAYLESIGFNVDDYKEAA